MWYITVILTKKSSDTQKKEKKRREEWYDYWHECLNSSFILLKVPEFYSVDDQILHVVLTNHHNAIPERW